MVREAEQNAAADKDRKEAIEARNNADSLVYSTEKSLSDHKDKLNDEEKAAVQKEVDSMKSISADGSASAESIKNQADRCAGTAENSLPVFAVKSAKSPTVWTMMWKFTRTRSSRIIRACPYPRSRCLRYQRRPKRAA